MGIDLLVEPDVYVIPVIAIRESSRMDDVVEGEPTRTSWAFMTWWTRTAPDRIGVRSTSRPVERPSPVGCPIPCDVARADLRRMLSRLWYQIHGHQI